MAHAVGEWIQAAGTRLPLMILMDAEDLDGVGRVWMARSILTGHVAAGASAATAKRCLRMTVERSIEHAHAAGATLRDWFAAQRRADPEHVQKYFEQAVAAGTSVDWSAHPGTTVAMAPA